MQADLASVATKIDDPIGLALRKFQTNQVEKHLSRGEETVAGRIDAWRRDRARSIAPVSPGMGAGRFYDYTSQVTATPEPDLDQVEIIALCDRRAPDKE